MLGKQRVKTNNVILPKGISFEYHKFVIYDFSEY